MLLSPTFPLPKQGGLGRVFLNPCSNGIDLDPFEL